jgi:hypothetical protein
LAAGSGEATLILQRWGSMHGKSSHMLSNCVEKSISATCNTNEMTEATCETNATETNLAEAWAARLVIDGCDPYTCMLPVLVLLDYSPVLFSFVLLVCL